MSLNFFAQTEHGDFSRLLQEAFSSLLHTCKQHGHQNKSALLQQRTENQKLQRLKAVADSGIPGGFFFGSSERRNLLVGGEALEEGGAEGLWGVFATPTGRDAGHLASPIFVAVRPMTTWAIHGPVCQFAEEVQLGSDLK